MEGVRTEVEATAGVLRTLDARIEELKRPAK
jgi:hypothetical protein